MQRDHISLYLLSLPERLVRSASALAAGLVREIGDVALPAWLRRTRLYSSLVDSTLRFLIEQVGQVEGAYPSDSKLAENFLLRRSAGNGIELIGILTFRASPVWVLAALADVSGAGKQLIGEIAAALKSEGLIEPDATVHSVEQLLDGMERTAGRLAETVNTPPLDVKSLREEWAAIRRDVASIPTPSLPTPERVWGHWRDLQASAASQNRSVWELSSLVALSAARQLPENVLWLRRSAAVAARHTGDIFAAGLLNHYRESLRAIQEAGYLTYWSNEFKPYLKAAASQFSPRRVSLTQKLIRKTRTLVLLTLACSALTLGQTARTAKAPPGPVYRLPKISADSLRAHVYFLASDLLEGRNTPSRGLDIAAEYIATQFRGAGLLPIEGSFVQETEFEAWVETGSERIPVTREMLIGDAVLDRARLAHVTTAEEITRRNTGRKAVVTTPELATQILAKRAELRPEVVLIAGDDAVPGAVVVRNPDVWTAMMKPDARITMIPAGLKNIIGVIRGVRPRLRDEYLLVTAHYDHDGLAPSGEDRVYNGANDNASSVAVLIETARLLQKQRPGRSVLFIAYYGEEKGLVGSRYYARHPSVPIAQTAAQINLEQLGRTDDSEGPRVRAGTLTGYDYSDVGSILTLAGKRVGLSITKHPVGSDAFFQRSDNEALAKLGVPSHTFAVSFGFPDYHAVGDEAEKLDYDNMAFVARGLAAGVLAIANRTAPPKWKLSNPKAKPFAEAATPLAKPPEASGPKF